MRPVFLTLDDKVNDMAAKIKSEMVLVTPEMARQYLAFNEQNRRVRAGWVNYLAYTIRSGEWKPTHQGIAFSESGRLLDGQHRMLAIVKADIPVNIMVTYGLPDDAFAAIDNGIKRTDGDLTRLPKRLVEVTKMFIQIMAFEGTESPTNTGSIGRMTPNQIHFYAGVLREFFDFMVKDADRATKVFSTTPVLSAAIYALMIGESPDYVRNTYRQLVSADTQSMPPICHSAVRQVMTGKITSKGGAECRTENFVRFTSVFKESNKNHLRLVARANKDVFSEVRSALKMFTPYQKRLSVIDCLEWSAPHDADPQRPHHRHGV